MVRRPWESVAQPVPGQGYLALLTYLPLRSFRTLPQFFRYSGAIQGQLRTSRGLIGFTLDAHPLRRQFWTLSVWEDEDALMEFVRTNPHLGTMHGLKGRMGATRFIRWPIEGSEVPPTWEDALARARVEERPGAASAPSR